MIVKEVIDAGRALRVEIQLVESRSRDDLEGAFVAMNRVDGLFVLADSTFFVHRFRIRDLVEKYRLPAMFAELVHVEIGGLMTYTPDYEDLWRRAATYVVKILEGARQRICPSSSRPSSPSSSTSRPQRL